MEHAHSLAAQSSLLTPLWRTQVGTLPSVSEAKVADSPAADFTAYFGVGAASFVLNEWQISSAAPLTVASAHDPARNVPLWFDENDECVLGASARLRGDNFTLRITPRAEVSTPTSAALWAWSPHFVARGEKALRDFAYVYGGSISSGHSGTLNGFLTATENGLSDLGVAATLSTARLKHLVVFSQIILPYSPHVCRKVLSFFQGTSSADAPTWNACLVHEADPDETEDATGTQATTLNIWVSLRRSHLQEFSFAQEPRATFQSLLRQHAPPQLQSLLDLSNIQQQSALPKSLLAYAGWLKLSHDGLTAAAVRYLLLTSGLWHDPSFKPAQVRRSAPIPGSLDIGIEELTPAEEIPAYRAARSA